MKQIMFSLVVLIFFIHLSYSEQQTPDFILQNLANFSCDTSWECPDISKHVVKLCACDNQCQIAGDCCQGYERDWDSTIISEDAFECLWSPLVEDGQHLLMVSKCPAEWQGPSIVRQLCESSPTVGTDVLQTIHVNGLNSNVTYKNQYCAICHKETYKYWKAEIGCNKTFGLSHDQTKPSNISDVLTSDSNCTIFRLFPPDNGIARKCYKPGEMVRSCPRSWPDDTIRELCEKPIGIQPVSYIGEITVKNIYCGFCGTPEIEKFQCIVDKPTVRTTSFYPFTILFDIDQLNRDNRRVVCAANQVYDPFTEICRDVFCSPDTTFKDGVCVQQNSTSTANNPAGVSDLDCPQIIINQSEFTIDGDGLLIVSNSKFEFKPGLFKLINGNNQAIVCTNFTSSNSTLEDLQYTFDAVQTILSVIGISLSILGCILTMAVYISFKTLRNVPGKIVISLCLSLTLAYLTMLIGPGFTEYLVPCKAFAILMHFAFMVAFFWMNVMAIDVWYTFSYHQNNSKSNRSSRFRLYTIYVFVAASIPSIVAIILNERDISDEFSPHFGKGICWFTRRNPLMLFFGLPTLLVILCNIILFMIAARTLHNAQQNSVRLLGKEDKSMFGIYIRLSIMMGLTYLVGFLVPIYNHFVILYIFIIINTLQGVFIFISFVCTRKVFALIKKRAKSWSISKSDSSYSGSRSTTKSSALSTRNYKI